jgi:hypothetical protein
MSAEVSGAARSPRKARASRSHHDRGGPRRLIEIGRRLIDAKAIAGHGNWLSWLDREFGTSTCAASICSPARAHQIA